MLPAEEHTFTVSKGSLFPSKLESTHGQAVPSPDPGLTAIWAECGRASCCLIDSPAPSDS